MDFAAVALIPYAMSQRLDLHLEGPVHKSLLANLDEYQDAWSLWRPDLFGHVRLSAEEVIEGTSSAVTAGQLDTGIAAFSGGIDSTFLVATHASSSLGYRTVRPALAVMIHGFDVPVDDDAGFAVALEKGRAILKEFSIPLASVRTNWRQFSPDWEMTFVAGVAAVLHQFAGHARVGMVAADYRYGLEPMPWGSNSITNSLLGSDAFPIRSTGFGTPRTRKCAFIAQWEGIRHSIRVCWAGPDPGHNCTYCEKCVRTKLNFLAAGIGEIPALGPLRKSEVLRLRTHEPAQLTMLREIAQYKDALPAPARQELNWVILRDSVRQAASAAPALRPLVHAHRRARQMLNK
jgi:hypothetical protein